MTTTTPDARFWDDAAEKYAAKAAADPSAFERKRAVLRELHRPDATVLEIGCGTGSLALAMAPHVGHVHAADISSAMIRIANEKKRDAGVTNVTFHHRPVDAPLPVEDPLDAVWAFSILHLVEDRRGVLERLFAGLRPGGVFASSNVCLRGGWVPYGAIIAVLRWFGKAPRVFLYDRAMLCRELEAVGFVDVVEHDVGAEGRVAFVTAKKPE